MPLIDFTVDWKKIWTTLLIWVAGGFVTLSWFFYDTYGEFQALASAFYESEQDKQKSVAQITNTMNRQTALLEMVIRNQTRVAGIGRVGNFGRNEEFIRINLGSRASLYADHPYAVVSVPTDSGRVRQKIKVGGVVTTSQPFIVEFSLKAAENLGISGNDIEVRLEPVEEDE